MSSFQRLLWKESRAWRSLWLGCVLGVIGLCLFLVLLNQAMHRGSGGWTMVLVAFAQAVPTIYVLAALAAMFAGEREERTAEWLTVLSPSPRLVIAAKLLFAVLSAALMQAALLLFAWIMSSFDSEQRWGGGAAAFEKFVREDLLLVSTWVLFEALAWGTLCALCTTYPLRAVLVSAALLAAANLVTAGAQGMNYRHNPDLIVGWANSWVMWGWLRTPFTAAVLIAGIALARRWVLGRYVTLEGLRLPRWSRPVRHSLRDAASAWQRAWQRLWWLERVHVQFYLVVSFLVCIVAIGTLFLERHATMAFAIIIGSFLPLFGGLAAWQGEQRRSQFRFYVDRGLPLAGLWVNKLLVWMGASLFAVGVLTAAVIGTWMFGTTISKEHWPPLFPLVRHFPSTDDMWLALGHSTVAVITSVVIGFLCGQLFRKGVIAFGAALIASLLMTMIFTTAARLGLPVLWFAMPIPVWLLYVSARHLSRMWHEQWKWRRAVLLAADLVLPPLVWCIAVAAYRVYEVPKPDLKWTSGYAQDLHQPDPSKPLVESVSRAELAQRWNNVARLIHSLQSLPETMTETLGELRDAAGFAVVANEPTERDWADAVRLNHEHLTDLRDELLRAHLLPSEAALWNRIPAPRVAYAVELMGRAAEQDLVEQRNPVGWLTALSRLAGAITCYAPLEQRHSMSQQLDGAVQKVLVRWAQHPLQTDETLQAGLTAAAREDDFWRVIESDVRAEFDRTEKELAESAGRPWQNSWTHLASSEVRRWAPWEFWRSYRLQLCRIANQRDYLRATRFTQPGWYVRESLMDARPSTAWTFRDPLWRYSHGDVPVGLENPIVLNFFERQTQFHGALAAAAVAGFTRVHGVVPDSLEHVAGYFVDCAEVLADPWSHEDLRYEPRGFSSDEFQTPTPLPEGVPVVWSVGPEHMLKLRTQDKLLMIRTEVGGNGSLPSPIRFQFAVPALPDVEVVTRAP